MSPGCVAREAVRDIGDWLSEVYKRFRCRDEADHVRASCPAPRIVPVYADAKGLGLSR